MGRAGLLALVRALSASGCPLEVLDVTDCCICGLDADGNGKWSVDAVAALCEWLKRADNPLRVLQLGSNQLCGLNWQV